MAKSTIQLRVEPQIAYVPLRLMAEVSTALSVDVNRLRDVRIVKRSIDARQRRVMVNLTVDAFVDDPRRRRIPWRVRSFTGNLPLMLRRRLW